MTTNRTEYQREYHRRLRANGQEYAQRLRVKHAALVAAAAEVTALWAAYAWHGTANKAALDDAVARLDALVGETGKNERTD